MHTANCQICVLTLTVSIISLPIDVHWTHRKTAAWVLLGVVIHQFLQWLRTADLYPLRLRGTTPQRNLRQQAARVIGADTRSITNPCGNQLNWNMTPPEPAP